MELRKRYPSKRDGELTHMRSALVSNVHLGRLLVRRLGEPTTLKFFGHSASRFKAGQLDKICDFIREASQGAPLAIVDALERHTKDLSAEGADAIRAEMRPLPSAGGDEATYYGKRGIDLRKPTGDTYEAIVGLLLLELGGDVDATWAVLARDFFPTDDHDEEEHARRLAQALKEARKASVLREQRLRAAKQGNLSDVSADAAMASGAPAPSVVHTGVGVAAKRTRGLAESEAPGMSKRSRSPQDEGARVPAVAQSAVVPPSAAAPPAVLPGIPGTSAATSAATSATTSAAASGALPSAAPAALVKVGPDNAIQTVNVQLAKRLTPEERKTFLREEMSKAEPFHCTIHALDMQVASSIGSSKLEARRLAYCMLYNDGRLEDLVHAFKNGTQPAAPLSANAGGQAVADVSALVSAAAEAAEPAAAEQAPAQVATAQAGAAEAAAAQAAAAQEVDARKSALLFSVEFLYSLTDRLPRYDAPRQPSDAEMADVFEWLGEEGADFKSKITKQVTKSRLCIDALRDVEGLAHQARTASGISGFHSAGRLFMEVLKKVCVESENAGPSVTTR